MQSTFGLMRSPQAILFGPGQRHAVGRVARALGRRALVCTDQRLSTDPQFAALRQSLLDAGAEVLVYDGTQPELPMDGVLECVALARPFAPELVLGIGGGSCMDMAKLVSLLLAHPGTTLDDCYGEFKVPGPVLPVIAMPTTAGTGSEVTPVAVVADQRRDLKVGVSSPHLIPHTAICDPELTLSCPPRLTAWAGADALTHAIEAFTATRREPTPELGLERVFVGKNLLSDACALAAISALSRHLPRAVQDGSDLAARAGVMFGALQAGLAFGTAGTAAAHAIQYPVGAITHTAHAVGVAVLMPYVMAFNRPACTASFAQIAAAMGVHAASEAAAADAAIEAVAGLLQRIGIPSTLAELGLDPQRAAWVAEQSMLAARLVTNNPRPLDEAAMARIVQAALGGERQALSPP
ncbi:iron-containing alcohol dehydrogenase [Ramlibacter sp. AW1]|uniref:Iron-containing alcohol dehydrogenase n=1 Tax=Ramlibacter aurantiacus TaxID=2801330 RepID=A0A936ZQW8_9BURK|nr:iron-containing alcohol dehydrogenase [Ramlibacter aurantiacus]MBL0420881.1 iron-containing alcohol dehydrogenase [Ramlibacter aurantiacus]